MTLKVARWSVRHPWRAIGTWLLLVVAAVACGAAITMHTTTDADYRVGQSGVAAQQIEAAGLELPDSEFVVLSATAGGPVGPSARAAAGRIATDVRGDARVERVAAPAVSPDKKLMIVAITMKPVADGGDPDISAITRTVHDAQPRAPGVRIVQTGDTSMNDAINTRVGNDLGSAESKSLPITIVLMLIVFAALIAAGIPVLLAIASVFATMGLMGPVSLLLPMEDTVTSVILLIGMAVGVDYSLFYLKRERQERHRGANAVDAVEIAAATSGHSIVVSGIAVIVSMGGLYTLGDVTFASIATGSLVVVAFAVFGSLTVLPALLTVLGPKVDRPRIPGLWRLAARMQPGAISKRLLAPVLRRPVVALAAGLVVLGALALPAIGMKQQTSSLDSLPQDIPAVRAMQEIGHAFPGDGPTASVVLQGANPDEVQSEAKVVASRAIATGDWKSVSDPVRVSADGHTAVLTLGSKAGEGSFAAGDAVRALRAEVIPSAVSSSHVTWAVGGGVAESYDQMKHQSDGLPRVLFVVLGLTLVMMTVTFRSIVVALLTTGLNLLSVGAAFGVLTTVFQHSWAESMLHFHSTGGVISWIPIFLFAVLVGLSMDYHVFVLSRVKERYDEGLPPKLAVRQGVQETAGVVTSAAVVMVSVFALFATLSMVEMKEIGVGLSVAIALDATVVRLVLLPSALALLGKWAWWPSRRRPRADALPVRPSPYSTDQPVGTH
ncbi:MMPL family transporter [Flexivirga oryzae]|uniref:RND superfamily putative drug exporter n=1 Tax=Flexivirga oryzae TaxID=1794944 RepID=A0A839N9G3_9MICO|nr:MMPL family transporter [Flexivirga oryzae]MBB2894418.1 RND superfamily putative drug exporter [Flexivirga oryzae]